MPFKLKEFYRFLPFFTLIAGLLMSAFVGIFTYNYYEQKEHKRLEIASHEIVLLIRERMATYEQILRSGVALFDVSDNVTRDAWATFVKEQKLNENYKGIQGFGYSEVVLARNEHKHEEQIREQGFPNYTIRPHGLRAFYAPVIYLEPFNARNKKALGYDVFSEKVRREAMLQAMQTGKAAITGKVTLIQENDKDVQTGFLMYMPVYKKGSKLDTHQDRALSIQGFVSAPFRINDLMKGILGTEYSNVNFDIYDDNSTLSDNILYRSSTNNEFTKIYKTINITINNHTWTIAFKTNNSVKNEYLSIVALVSLLSLMATFLLYLFLRSLIKTDEDLIQVMQKRYIAMFNKHDSIMLLIDSIDGTIIDANESAQNFYGYTYEEFLSLNIGDINQLSREEIALLMPLTVQRKQNHFIFQHKLKNGEIRTVEVFGSPIEIENGKLIFSIIRDVTKEQEFLNQIKKEAFRKELALSTGIVGIWEWNIDTNTLIWDGVMYQIYGITQKDGESPYEMWSNAIDPNDKPAVEANLLSAKENNVEYHISFWIRTPAGERKYIQAIGKYELDDFGKAFKMVGLNIDITEQKNREIQLKTLLNQQEALYKVQTVGFVHLKDRHFKWTNEIFETMLGYEKGELQGKPARIMYHDEEEYISYGRDGYEALKNTGIFTREIKCVKKDGSQFFVLASMTSLYKDSTEAVGVAFDITEIKKQAKLIEKQHEEFKTIFDISRDGLAILDLESNFLDFNDAYLAMTGFTREELLATSCIALSIPEDHERAIQAIKIVTEIGYLESFEKTCIVKNGKYIVIKMAMSFMPDKKRILISTKDITDMRHHEEQLEFIAHFDPLTKLPNRVLLSDRMKQSIATAHRNNGKLAIAYLDLDGFKQVNDIYGHDAGDILLIEVSKRMQESLREGDTLARLGGDEFVAILGDQNDKSETFTVLNRLLNAAAFPVDIQNAVVTVSASVGVTFYTKGCDIDADILLRQADQAMYEAKLRGKNQIAVFDDISDFSNQVGENALAIKNALNNNEFMLHYQPKVNMKSGQVIGAEALIRWNDPQRGILYPDEFLSVVDNRPLMYEIDKWVLNAALSQLDIWHTEGFDTKVSINISAYTFKQPDFIYLIDKAVAKHPNLQPYQIDIEILESSSLHDIEDVRQIIEQLHERNITVSLDDFGTGYSTLSYLKKLGIDTLKIDKSFVLDILYDEGDLSIVNASVGLAEAFNAKPLAEGVESVEHGNVLLGLGCHLAQGYIISRAMSSDLLPTWVKEWKPPESWQGIEKV